jgi:hypothetical protein
MGSTFLPGRPFSLQMHQQTPLAAESLNHPDVIAEWGSM